MPAATGAGSVSLQLLIILVPVLFGLMGFAIDLGRLYLIRGELNQAATAMAMAAAQQLNGTAGSLEIAALAANNTISQDLGDGNKYNFGSLVLGDTTGTLSSTVPAPLFYSAVSDAIDPTSTNYADGTTARFVQVNLQADAPLLFWSFLPLGQTRKTSVGAFAVAGVSAPLCTVCSMEDFAVADQSGGADTVDFGFVFNTKYTFYFDCTGTPGTATTLIPDATAAIPYVMIDRYNPNLTLDETQQLFRTGAGGLIPLPMSSANRQMSCFTVTAAEFLWGNAGNGGTSTVPTACGNAGTANLQVEQMLCGLYARFSDPTVLTACAGVTSLTDIAPGVIPDTDTADYDDYTAYGGNGKRIITVPIVDTLSTAATTTMNVLGFRQFLVTPTPNPNTGLGNDPSDVHGKFNAIYLGSIVPVKQGFYNSLVPPGTAAACAITSGPGKVVLHQ
jgi:Flp pilus assembly protein TadG